MIVEEAISLPAYPVSPQILVSPASDNGSPKADTFFVGPDPPSDDSDGVKEEEALRASQLCSAVSQRNSSHTI